MTIKRKNWFEYLKTLNQFAHMMVLFFPNDITKIELLLQAPKSSAIAIAKCKVIFSLILPSFCSNSKIDNKIGGITT